MGKKSDLAQQIAALQKEHDESPDDNDDDLEIVVEKDGQKVTLKGRHARAHMKRVGLDDPDPEPDPDDGKGDGGKDPEPPAGHRYFRK